MPQTRFPNAVALYNAVVFYLYIISIHVVPHSTLRVLLEELLGFVDLGGQVRTASSIGVVEQHQSSVGFADLIFRHGAFATSS